MKVHEEIEETEKKLEELREKAARLDAMAPEYQLAEELHELFCPHNHTDGCGWFYETWEAPRHSRKAYLEKAQKVMKLMAGFDHDAIIEVAKALRY